MLKLGFKAAYAFRPALIQPLRGIKSRTPSYRILYTLLGPLMPVFKAVLPSQFTTTERIGQAMINVVTKTIKAYTTAGSGPKTNQVTAESKA